MSFSALGAKVWPVTPDWARPVEETLAWATDPLRSTGTLKSHHRSYALGPRRSFSFDLLAWEQEHRVIEMLLAGWRGTWLLPIFPDVQWLHAPLSSGASTIPCATTGYDFRAGGKALLYRSVNRWEIVEVDSIGEDHIAVTGAIAHDYDRSCRLYPLRLAMHQDGAEAQLLDHETQSRSITFDIAEACDWPLLPAGGEYRGHRVLDRRPDESDRPSSAFTGAREIVDYGDGLPVVNDVPGIALRLQRDSWRISGRSELAWFRSLLHTLHGRRNPIWVPSWSHDLMPAATIGASSTSVSVEWAGYTLFGLDKPNRQDLRIELNDGTVFLRRVLGAVEAGDTETLTLDGALSGSSIAPGAIRQVSIMSLCTLASDRTEISHVNGASADATATTGWQGVVPDA